jgi:membrane-associated HD superfamily phosphohydrolase
VCAAVPESRSSQTFVMTESAENGTQAPAAVEELSAEKKAQKDAKAAAKKAEKEAKKQKALEKQKKQQAEKEAQALNSSKKAEEKAAKKAKADAKAAEVQAKIDQARATPSGEKKDVSLDPPDSYHPKYDVVFVAAVVAQWATRKQCGTRFEAKDRTVYRRRMVSADLWRQHGMNGGANVASANPIWTLMLSLSSWSFLPQT